MHEPMGFTLTRRCRFFPSLSLLSVVVHSFKSRLGYKPLTPSYVEYHSRDHYDNSFSCALRLLLMYILPLPAPAVFRSVLLLIYRVTLEFD